MANKKVTNWEYFLIDIGDLVGGFITGLSIMGESTVGIFIGLGCIIGTFIYKSSKGFYSK